MEMIWVWLAVVAVSLIVEFFTWDLTSIWFAVAGLVALIMSAIDGINWVWQLGVFIVISAVLIIFVRQICRKLLLKSDEKTNVDAFIGKKAKLLTAVGENENFGTVKFNGVVWNATTENGNKLEKDTEVEVVKVDGNKMIVKAVVEGDSTEQKQEVEDKKATKSTKKRKEENVEKEENSKEEKVDNSEEKKEEKEEK